MSNPFKGGLPTSPGAVPRYEGRSLDGSSDVVHDPHALSFDAATKNGSPATRAFIGWLRAKWQADQRKTTNATIHGLTKAVGEQLQKLNARIEALEIELGTRSAASIADAAAEFTGKVTPPNATD